MRAAYRYLVAPIILAVGVSSTLTGCTHVTDGKPAIAHHSTAHGGNSGKGRSGTAKSDYDISRVSDVQQDFPPEQKVHVEPPEPLGDKAAGFASLASGDYVIDPPGCIALAQPVRPGPDAQASVVGAQGGGLLFVAAVQSPQPLSDDDTGEVCTTATMTETYQGRTSESTLTALAAPQIDGVRTNAALAETITGHTKSYVYSAFLSDTVAVTVLGMLPGNPREEAIFADLLVKAVDAVRG